MTTMREIVGEAMRKIKALAPGDDPVVDELNLALDFAQSILLEMHEARGVLYDVDVSANYTAGENERVRVTDGFTVEVTTPNWINRHTLAGTNTAVSGTTRRPTDGARIEVVAESQRIWFYKADTNDWQRADSLTVASTFPLSARYRDSFTSYLAHKLMKAWPDNIDPPAWLEKDAEAGIEILRRPYAGQAYH